jgi:tRNA A-37 threonylcarbamoyl transferase component Bud32/tetratricopeptide (TPR) repeat protein
MVHANTPCPSADILELIALGRGSTADVEYHVQLCDTCRALLDEMRANEQFLNSFRPALRAAPAPTLPATGPHSDTAPDFPLSVDIAGYHNVVELSRGGQGIVYRAVHTLTKRKVAIKMLLRGAYASARELHRFEREIEIVAALRHPNIVTVFDSGVTPDDRPYVVMEYIHGVPLDKYAHEKLATTSKRSRCIHEHHLRLFARVAAAVQHAHSRGVIHRDLKPGNILVDDAGEPHIVDFGMARSLSLARGPTPTMTHEFGGTLAYASPEQVAGDPERIDIRTDVYSLGVVLYELLTGEHPYPVSGPIGDVVRNIEHAEPVRPSSIQPSIRDELETIMLKSLAKEPERRYQSAGGLARDVEDFLAGRPIAARSDSAWYLITKMARRHRAGVLTAAVIGLLLAGCAAAAIVADRANVHLDGVRDGITRIFASLQLAKGDSTPRERFRDILDAGAAEVAPAFEDLPADEAVVRGHLGHGYWEIGESAKAEEQFKRILEIREGAGAPLADTAALRMQLARICASFPTNRFEDALAYLDDATIQAVRDAGNPRLLAEILWAAGSIKLKTDLPSGIAALNEARAVLDAIPEADELRDNVDDSLAHAYLVQKHPDRALDIFKRIYDRMRRKYGDRHLQTAIRLDSIADCEYQLGHFAEALAHYEQVHDVYSRIMVRPDQRLYHSLLQLARANEKAGNADAAARFQQEADAMKFDLERTAPRR